MEDDGSIGTELLNDVNIADRIASGAKCWTSPYRWRVLQNFENSKQKRIIRLTLVQNVYEQ